MVERYQSGGQASTGATAYDLRYAVETCPESLCVLDSWTQVDGIATNNRKLTAGTDGNSQLEPSTVYRIQVRATNAPDASSWSSPAFVYPTSSPPQPYDLLGHKRLPVIATAPLYGYQAPNQHGSHFDYIICGGTIPSGVTITAQKMKDAVDKWQDAVKKDSSTSIITTTEATSVPADACQPPEPDVIVFLPGHNSVIFADDDAMNKALCYVDRPRACWRSTTLYTVFADRLGGMLDNLPTIERGTILLREAPTVGGSASNWNGQISIPGGFCSLAEHTITHEVGHALGIGGIRADFGEDHPRNSALSIMSSGPPHHPYQILYCEPEAFDILAVMANYQSR